MLKIRIVMATAKIPSLKFSTRRLLMASSLTQLQTLDPFEVSPIPSQKGQAQGDRGGRDQGVCNVGAVLLSDVPRELGDGAVHGDLPQGAQNFPAPTSVRSPQQF